MGLRADRIEDTSIEQTSDSIALTRRFFVDELPTTTPSAVAILALNYPGVPALFDGHPQMPQAKVARKSVKPSEASDGTQMVVLVTYEVPRGPEAPTGGGTPFVITDDTGLRSVPSQILPGHGHAQSGKPFQVAWTNPNDATDKVGDTVTLNLDLPVRQIVLEGRLAAGANLEAIREAEGFVNDNTWRGKPKGYWRLSRFVTRTLDAGLSYFGQVVLETKQIEDWSEIHPMRDTHTGKFIPVRQNDILALQNTIYSYGVDSPSGKGIIKVCPHREASFSSLFGIS